MTDDLPTPPLPDAMASTRVLAGTDVSGASSRAFQRARAMTAARSSASMAATRTSTERTQSRDSTWLRTSRSIWFRKGQAAMVSATSTTTCPPATVTARTIPRSTIVSPSSGSTTARRASRTSSSGRLRGASAAGGVVASDPGGMKGDSTCVAPISGPPARGYRARDGAGNMGTSTAQGAP